MQTIEALLISLGELDRIYKGESQLVLWRALHKTAAVTNPLYPDFEAREVRAGVLRAPDVEIRNVGGVPHVVARLRQGTSLFDKEGVFGHKQWQYVEIPAGTKIPDGLIITRDDYNQKYQATHYSISPNYTMPKAAFMRLLDQLAANALSAQRRQGSG